jgi:uncharacterized protein (DUF1697 family)
MKYVAFLRGINVGGNTPVSMAHLKSAVEHCGYTNVVTYINSGNVIFDTEQTNITAIIKKLETVFVEKLHHTIPIALRSLPQMKKTLENIPSLWKKNADVRCYLAFTRESLTPADVIKETPVNPDVDQVDAGPDVVYMTTKKSGLTKSGFSKLIGKKVYKEITMRNLNTTQKVFALMKR